MKQRGILHSDIDLQSRSDCQGNFLSMLAPVTNRIDLEAMRAHCEVQFSGYGSPIWTQFLSTASQQRGASAWLTFGGRDGQWRAGNDGAVQAKLGVFERRLQQRQTLGQLLWVSSHRGR
jgi:hypothetical protein